ncbi:MAG: ATP-dependent sacrificial sulfur transferase LarE [Oscillospiraceae bacterium]|nr:ATP-dependent sacrificial sulfur transferase LarE [Oscillospiraceae bacterium]
MNLIQFFAENPVIAMGFSGGVDSSYLLYEAQKYAKKVRAYYVKSAFQPQFELDDARKLAQQIGADLRILQVNILSHQEIISNLPNRCYFCKRAIFGTISSHAAQDGFPVLIDGTNASDAADDRPGMRALKEMSVRSPLRECGLTKSEIRKLSKEAGLLTWDKPAYACLATRVPFHEPLNADLLDRIEQAENILFQFGFTDFRVRVFKGAARLQLKEEQWALAKEKRGEILAALQPFFHSVLLDFQVR